MPDKNILNTPLSIQIGLWLARVLPPRAGRRAGEWIGGLSAANPTTARVRAVSANQRVIAGEVLSRVELRRRTLAVFHSSGRCLYDFYHNYRAAQAVREMVEITPAFQRCIERGRRGEAQFLLVPHLSNFDLVGMAAVHAGLAMQVLTYPGGDPGYRMQNVIRAAAGMEAAPISLESLRAALGRLRGGGTVLTGIDRPLDGANIPPAERPTFFGRPANLSTGYLRIAMSAGAPLVVAAGQTTAAGGYRLWASDPLPAPRGGPAELKRCAEEALAIAAELIRQAPEQWAMFYPVWPDEEGKEK